MLNRWPKEIRSLLLQARVCNGMELVGSASVTPMQQPMAFQRVV